MKTFIPKGNLRGFIMPDFVFKDCKLSLGAKTLYALLCNYAGDKDHCWPAHQTLAQNMGCSLSSVKTYLKQLVERGLVAANNVAENRVRSCMYYMLRPQASSSACSQNLAISQVNSGYNLNLTDSSENTPLPPKHPKQSAGHFGSKFSKGGRFMAQNLAFESFFAAYPRKEGKELARSVWYSLARSKALPSLDVLQAALTSALSSEAWRKEAGRFIPMPSNYLRGQRWLDAPTAAPAQSKENSESGLAALIQKREAEQKLADRKKCSELRPAFEALASKFCSGVNSMAFGIWSLLHEKGIAPTESDVPSSTEGISFFHWLNTFKLNCVYTN